MLNIMSNTMYILQRPARYLIVLTTSGVHDCHNPSLPLTQDDTLRL